MKKKLIKLIKYITTFLFVLLLSIIMGVGFYIFAGPKLQVWHTYVPNEMTAEEIDSATWEDYIKRERQVFEDVHENVVRKIPEDQQTKINRYYENSLIYPPHFKEDWNRSYLFNVKNPKGAVVMLHGLTDAPYSLRHVAETYQKRGFVVVGIRIPGHGTVPGGLTKVTWQEMMAATRLAVRTAKELIPENAPLHLVGFSNGGAIAVKYALDAIEDENLARPDRLILISPMIGITPLAKIAEIMDFYALIPGFERGSWLGISPEFNPFKFNSFPVNALKQARLFISELRRQIVRLHASGEIKQIPPVTTFQSIADYTVSTPAIINNLYAYLPNNGSELVIFDVNQATVFNPLIRPVFLNITTSILPDLPQPYRITIISNSSPKELKVVEKIAEAGEKEFSIRSLNLLYPADIFSLSHIALPFPVDDALYGINPKPGSNEEFGLNLGLMSSAQGERGVLEININMFFRIASNPFFEYVRRRIAEKIETPIEPAIKQADFTYASPMAKMSPEEYEKLTEQ